MDKADKNIKDMIALKTGQRIYNARKSAGLTQSELGKKVGVDGTTIMRYEQGTTKRMRMDLLVNISKALNIDPLELTGMDYVVQANELGNQIENQVGLNERDKKDIAKDLDSIMNKLENAEDGPLNYNGEEIPEETVQLLKYAIEMGLTQLKIINKEKYGRKKHKEDK